MIIIRLFKLTLVSFIIRILLLILVASNIINTYGQKKEIVFYGEAGIGYFINSKSLERKDTYKDNLGYNFSLIFNFGNNVHLRTEFLYNHFQDSILFTLNHQPAHFLLSSRKMNCNLNVEYSLKILKPLRILFFGGTTFNIFAYSHTYPISDLDIKKTRFYQGFNLGTGLELKLSRRLSLVAEFQYLFNNKGLYENKRWYGYSSLGIRCGFI